MNSLNSLSENLLFRKTILYNEFKESPLGFIDAGAAGGAHPLVMPVASLVHCTCFDPNTEVHERILQDSQVFASFTLIDKALGHKVGKLPFYLTESQVNSSLSRPLNMLTQRYGVKGLNISKEFMVDTETLDRVVFKEEKRLGEFIKLDCQAAEYDILQKGTRTLDEQCMALWSEVQFFPLYENQKIFSDMDLFLSKKGFSLYGLYPNYVSTRKLDRRMFETEERLVWADAFYIKDPLADINREKTFTQREINVVILIALLTGYYDFALELITAFYPANSDSFVDLVRELSASRKKIFMQDWANLLMDREKSPQNEYLLAKRFVDRHVSNNNINFLTVET